MLVFASSVHPPLGAIDTATTVVLVAVAAAVVLVFWASRPSVIARYSMDNRPSDGRESAAPPSAPGADDRRA